MSNIFKCKPQLSQKTSVLMDDDVIQVEQTGKDKFILAKDLINLIVAKLSCCGNGDAYKLAVYAKNLADKHEEDIEALTRNVNDALLLAQRAWELALSFDSRITALENAGISLDLTELINLVEINTTNINNLLNGGRLTVDSTVTSASTIYRLLQDEIEIAQIVVPKPLDLIEYLGSLHIDVNNRVISTKNFADVAESGDYSDLKNTPTNVSTFNNDVPYLTNADLTSILNRLQLLEGNSKERVTTYSMSSKIIEPQAEIAEDEYKISYRVYIDKGTANLKVYTVGDWRDITFEELQSCTIDVCVLTHNNDEVSYWTRDFKIEYNGKEVPATIIHGSLRDREASVLYRFELVDIHSGVIISGRFVREEEAEVYVCVHDRSNIISYLSDNNILVGGGTPFELDSGRLVSRGYEWPESIDDIEIDEVYPENMRVEVLGTSSGSIEYYIDNLPVEGYIVFSGFNLLQDDSTPEIIYYGVSRYIEHGSIDGPTSVTAGTTNATWEVYIDEGYRITGATVQMGNSYYNAWIQNGGSEDDYALLITNGSLAIDDNIKIEVQTEPIIPERYKVSASNKIKNFVIVRPTEVEERKPATITVTPNSGYSLIITKVTVGTKVIINQNISGNIVQLDADQVTGDIVIDGILESINTEVDVFNYIPNTTIDKNKLILNSTNQTILLSPNEGYSISTLSVTNNKVASTNNVKLGENYLINIAKVNGNIEINGKVTKKTINLSLNSTPASMASLNTTSLEYGTTLLDVFITINSGYKNIKVSKVIEGSNNITSKLTITKSSDSIRIKGPINGSQDITIYVTGEALGLYTVTLAGNLANGGTISLTTVTEGGNIDAIITNSRGVCVRSVTMGGTSVSNYTCSNISSGVVTLREFTLNNISGNVVITGDYVLCSKGLSMTYAWYLYNNSGIPNLTLFVLLDTDPITAYVVGVDENPGSVPSFVTSNSYLEHWRINDSNTGTSYDPSTGMYFLALAVDPKFLNLEYKTWTPAVYFQYKDIKVYYAPNKDNIKYANYGTYCGTLIHNPYLNTAYAAFDKPGTTDAQVPLYDISRLNGKHLTTDLKRARADYAEFSYAIYESDSPGGSNSRVLKLVITDNVRNEDSGQKLLKNTTGSESSPALVLGGDNDWFTLKCWCNDSLENIYCNKPGIKDGVETQFSGLNPGRFAEYYFKVEVHESAPANASLTFVIGPEGGTESNKALKTFTVYK